jgi:ABC-type glycerol-3-phosphate transport system permease component
LVLVFVAFSIPIAKPGMVAVFLVVLMLFIGQYEVAWEAMSAAAVLTMLPPLVLALFFQRYLVRGMTLGAVKG